ncbi:MAG: 1-deoxy-D-xylulose-5-phosphate synthase, partial [Clostridia bacterium]|nr:1-deoxy-D-xylulose-5-phosphate synthase [Clostridia bacterium]
AGRRLLVTLEDNALAGGFGSAVNEKLAAWGLRLNVMNLGLPDRFIEQGAVAEQLEECGLTARAVADAVAARFAAAD